MEPKLRGPQKGNHDENNRSNGGKERSRDGLASEIKLPQHLSLHFPESTKHRKVHLVSAIGIFYT